MAVRNPKDRSEHGLGHATENVKIIDIGADELSRITGQRPVTTRAKKSLAAFKLRKGMPIGSMVTLRSDRMYEFLDDSRPDLRGFDEGNYTLGLRDQLNFLEIDYMRVDQARGMNVSVVTTARTDEEARRLLQLIGMPFRVN